MDKDMSDTPSNEDILAQYLAEYVDVNTRTRTKEGKGRKWLGPALVGAGHGASHGLSDDVERSIGHIIPTQDMYRMKVEEKLGEKVAWGHVEAQAANPEAFLTGQLVGAGAMGLGTRALAGAIGKGASTKAATRVKDLGARGSTAHDGAGAKPIIVGGKVDRGAFYSGPRGDVDYENARTQWAGANDALRRAQGRERAIVNLGAKTEKGRAVRWDAAHSGLLSYGGMEVDREEGLADPGRLVRAGVGAGIGAGAAGAAVGGMGVAKQALYDAPLTAAGLTIKGSASKTKLPGGGVNALNRALAMDEHSAQMAARAAGVADTDVGRLTRQADLGINSNLFYARDGNVKALVDQAITAPAGQQRMHDLIVEMPQGAKRNKVVRRVLEAPGGAPLIDRVTTTLRDRERSNYLASASSRTQQTRPPQQVSPSGATVQSVVGPNNLTPQRARMMDAFAQAFDMVRAGDQRGVAVIGDIARRAPGMTAQERAYFGHMINQRMSDMARADPDAFFAALNNRQLDPLFDAAGMRGAVDTMRRSANFDIPRSMARSIGHVPEPTPSQFGGRLDNVRRVQPLRARDAMDVLDNALPNQTSGASKMDWRPLFAEDPATAPPLMRPSVGFRNPLAGDWDQRAVDLAGAASMPAAGYLEHKLHPLYEQSGLLPPRRTPESANALASAPVQEAPPEAPVDSLQGVEEYIRSGGIGYSGPVTDKHKAAMQAFWQLRNQGMSSEDALYEVMRLLQDQQAQQAPIQ